MDGPSALLRSPQKDCAPQIVVQVLNYEANCHSTLYHTFPMATPSSIRRLACSSSGSRQTRCLHDTVTRATSSPTSHASRTSSSTPPSQRSFATAPYTSSEPESEEIRPRWQSTPRGMTMPFRIRPMDKNNQWRVNDDPKKLNDFYVRMLGPGGDSLLSEETKWLAVTHKSFDQGKRGFNDRLSYFGVYPRYCLIMALSD